MIKAIIFDLGGVILTHKFEVTLISLAEIFKIEEDKFLDVFKKYEDSWVKGEISAKKFALKFKQEFKSNLSLGTILKCWKDIYQQRTQVNKELISLIKKLRKKYKIYLLTNTTDLHHNMNMKRAIFHHFDKIFASFLVGMRKPNKDFYEHVLKKIKVKPQECIFIDDRFENIETAQKLNINAILFEDNQKLVKDLKKFKVGLA